MTQAPVAVVISENGDWDDGEIVPMSISHDGNYATAVCMASEASPGADVTATPGWKRQLETDTSHSERGEKELEVKIP